MRKSLLIVFLFLSAYCNAQTLPLDFETTYVWENFDGGEVTTIANPHNNSENSSANVGKMVKNTGQNWGGSYLTLSSALDFNNNNTFSMKVFSIKANTKVLLKVENSANTSTSFEKELTMSKVNEWETLNFDYSTINAQETYDRVVLIFDLGTVGDGSPSYTYYIDDISLFYQAPNCTSGNTGANPTTTSYELVWADEFSQDGAPCSLNWGYDLGAGGWGNGESQTYTSSLDNAIVENGVLKIKAKKNGNSYTSARLKTQEKYNFKYGKVDVRAKLPAAQGTWPAIWMLGSNFPTAGWPHCGEIDIMEQTGQNKNESLATLHWYNNAGNNNASYGETTNITNASSEFHVFSLEWTPNEVKILLDGNQYYVLANNDNLPFNNDFFIILNIAMGGTLGGTIDPNFSEDTMEIDYVRVYQRSETASNPEPNVAAPTPTENVSDVISIFSDTYTNISGVDLNPNWNQSTTTSEVSIQGNNTLKYKNLNYQGTDFSGNQQDVSSMTHLHFDYWTADATQLDFYLINATTGGAGEKFYDVDVEDGITTQNWISINVPLTHFTNQGFTLNDIMQFKVVGNGTVFLDNMYFVNNPSLTVNEFGIEDILVLSNPTSEKWTINTSNNIIKSLSIYNLLGKEVIVMTPNSNKVTVFASHLKRGIYIAKINTDKGSEAIKLLKE